MVQFIKLARLNLTALMAICGVPKGCGEAQGACEHCDPIVHVVSGGCVIGIVTGCAMTGGATAGGALAWGDSRSDARMDSGRSSAKMRASLVCVVPW